MNYRTAVTVAMLYVTICFMAGASVGGYLLDSWHKGGPGGRTSFIARLEKEARLSVVYAAEVREQSRQRSADQVTK